METCLTSQKEDLENGKGSKNPFFVRTPVYLKNCLIRAPSNTHSLRCFGISAELSKIEVGNDSPCDKFELLEEH